MEGTVILPCHSQVGEYISQSEDSISAVSQSEGSIHLGHVVVVPDVIGEETLGLQVGHSVRPITDIVGIIDIYRGYNRYYRYYRYYRYHR